MIINYPQTDSEKVQRISATFEATINDPKVRLLRSQIIRNLRYVIGDQIDKDILDKLAAAKRPALIFQLLHPHLLFIAGTIKKDRKKLRAVPMRYGDEDLSALHNVLVSDWWMGNCDGYDEYAKAALYAVTAKIGWINDYFTTRGNPLGKGMTVAEDPLSILFDIDGKKLDQTDWRWVCKQGFYTANEIVQTYDQYLDDGTKALIKEESERVEGIFNKAKDGKPIGVWDRIKTFAQENFGDDTGKNSELINNFVDVRNGIYRVIEWHDRRTVEKRFVRSPYSGQAEPIPDELLAAEKKAEYDQFIQSAKDRVGYDATVKIHSEETLWITPVVPGLIKSKPIFEKPYVVQNKGFQYKPLFCYDFHPDLTKTNCVVDSLITPSDFFNQRMMSMLTLVLNATNPNIAYHESALPDPEDLDSWKSADRGKMLRYKGDKKPEPIRDDEHAFQLHKIMADMDINLMQEISPVKQNMRGESETSNEPASLYAQRVEQGMVMLAHLFSNIYKTMRISFNYVDATIQKHVTFERMIRLLEEPPKEIQVMGQGSNAYWIAINQETLDGIKNDITQGEYDFRLDTTASSSTERRIQTMFMMELAKNMAAGGASQAIRWDLIIEAQEFSKAKEWAQFVRQVMGIDMQQQQKQKEMQDAAANMSLIEKAKNLIQPQKQLTR